LRVAFADAPDPEQITQLPDYPLTKSSLRPMSKTVSFSVGPVSIGSGLFLIAGPCVIESEAHALKMAELIATEARSQNIPYIFKASYDKANRTSLKSFRGPGITEGLRILKKIKDTLGLPVLTDVHETKDVPQVAEVVDIVQIPAFLCRQTDLLVAAAKHARAINVKKDSSSLPGTCGTPSKKSASRATTTSFSPNAAAPLATTIWWSICARWQSCGDLPRWSSTRPTPCSFRLRGPTGRRFPAGSRSLSSALTGCGGCGDRRHLYGSSR